MFNRLIRGGKVNGDFKTVCEEIQYTPTTIFVDKEGNTIGNAITAAIDSEMDSKKLADIYTGCVNEVLKEMLSYYIQNQESIPLALRIWTQKIKA